MKYILISFLLITISVFAQIEVVKIGNLYWATKNLNLDRFSNGEIIPEAKTEAEWEYAISKNIPAWCYYDNNPENGEKYGKLYNWYAVIDPRGLAPEGLHIPTPKEWESISAELGENAGFFMKSNSDWADWQTGGPKKIICRNCSDWSDEYKKKVACHICKDTRQEVINEPIVKYPGNGNNNSGFNALPGGIWSSGIISILGSTKGKFKAKYHSGCWWANYKGVAFAGIDNSSNKLFINKDINNTYLKNGYSVRLVKNDENLNRLIQEKKQRTKDSLLAQQTLKEFNSVFESISKQIDDKKIELAKIGIQNLKSKYKDVEQFGVFKISGLFNEIKKLEDKLEFLIKPLNDLENLLVGEWKFKSKNIYGNNDQIFIIEEDWLVNSDRTYIYRSRWKKFLENKYFNEYLEKGMFEIINDTSNEILLIAHINEENGKPSTRIDKIKFDKISSKKASRTLNFKDAKYPAKITGKKVSPK